MNDEHCPNCSSLLAGLNGMKACLTCAYYEPAQPAPSAYLAPSQPMAAASYSAPLQTATAGAAMNGMNAWTAPFPQTNVLPTPDHELVEEMFNPGRETEAGDQPVVRKHRGVKALVLIIMIAVLSCAGIFTYGEVTAINALKVAHPKLQNGQYEEALTVLRTAYPVITFGSVREELRTTTSKADRWAYQHAILVQANLLIKDGKYQEASTLLQGITNDFPDYNKAREYIRQANREAAKHKAAPKSPSESSLSSQSRT